MLRIFLIFLLLTAAAPQASAESMAKAAARISKARAEKAELQKNRVKAGEKIQDVGDLSIEDFLKLDAVPDGMDAVSAQTLSGASDAFGFMSPDQAVQAIAAMRAQGIDLPRDLEENIKKDPENASKLMNDAFMNIQPADIQSQDDVSKQRKAAIGEAESNFGIGFKDIMDQQKQMRESVGQKPKRRRGRGGAKQ